jgi:hypothetical protein
MAKALISGKRAQREAEGAKVGRKPKYPTILEREEFQSADPSNPPIPFDPAPVMNQLTPIVQPTNGLSVGAAAKEAVVESAEIPEDPDYTFTFELEQSIGHKWKVIATRDDGEQQEQTFNSRDEADKWLCETQEKIHQTIIEKEEAKLKKKHQPLPLTPVVDGKIITLHPDPPKNPKIHGFRSRRKGEFYPVPELIPAITEWVAGREIESFSIDDEGGIRIITFPDAQKATFSFVGERVIKSIR